MRRIVVVWNDIFHYREIYADTVARLFEKKDEVIYTEHIRDVVQMCPQPDLVLNFSIGCGKPDDHEPLNTEEQEKLYAAVHCVRGSKPAWDAFMCMQDWHLMKKIRR